MSIVTDFQAGVNEALDLGKPVRFQYYSTGYGAGSYYDDDVTLTKSGDDLWMSGVVLPITNKQGSNDAILLEQGQILMNDSKLYIDGSISTSGTLKIGLGSYVNMSGCEYSLLVEGVTNWEVNNTDILKKLYVRNLTTGSLAGE